MYEQDQSTPVSAITAAPITDLPAPSLPVADLPAPSVPVADLPVPPVAAPAPPVWPPAPAVGEPLRPTIAVWQLLLIVAGLCAVVAGAVVLLAGGPQAASTVKVPIELRGWPGGPHGVLPVVRVSIDGGPPVPVLLDTGSTGLNILAKDVPAQAHLAPLAPFSESWGGGNLTTAREAQATISIAGVSTTRQVPIGLVQSVSCLPGLHHCMRWAEPGVDGILGIRMDPRFALTNPLASLPAPYSQSWSVSLSSTSGTLALGASIPAHPTASFPLLGLSPADLSLPPGLIPAQPNGSSSSLSTEVALPGSGVTSYVTGMPTMCWRLGRSGTRVCVPTLFDTGSTDTVLFSKRGGLPTRVIPAGKPLTAWTSSTDAAPLWSLTTGSAASENLVLTDGHAVALMDAGIAPFYAFNVTYDNVHRRMYLSPGAGVAGGSLWRRSADAVCSTFTARAKTALEHGPHASPTATLAHHRAADAFYLKTWGRWSLKADEAFARLDLPPALRPVMARALAADRAASRMMIRVAPTILRSRTARQLTRGLEAFQRRYTADEAPWEKALERLKIAGCG